MIVDDLIRTLANRDVELYLVGDRLRFRAPEGALTPELRSEIGAQRTTIIEHLRAASVMATELKRCTRCDWRNWVDAAPKDGRIRTTCGKCGRFIGYRPAEPEMA